MKSTIKFLVLTMLLVIAIAAFAGCALTEHNWTEATCTAPKTCTDCGITEGEALGHTEQIVEAKAATCYETGLTEGKVCSVCNETLVAQKIVLSLGHDLVIDQPQNATCTDTGLSAGAHCSRCDYKEEPTVVPALGHSYMFPCDAHCMVCGELTNENAAHTVVAVEAKAATCTANGNIAYWYCSDCGTAWTDEARTQLTNQMNVVVPALGHSYMFPCDAHCMVCGELTNENAAHTIVAVVAKAATCTAPGNTAYWCCSDCGTAWSDEACTQLTNRMNVTLPALGHSYMFPCDAHCMVCGDLTNENATHNVTFVPGYAATCTDAGVKDYYECSLCNYRWLDADLIYVATRFDVIIPATGHNIVPDEAVTATCTDNGLTAGEHCTQCDYKVAQETVPALGHNWVDATVYAPKTCTNCGATEGAALVAQAAIGEVKFLTLAEALAAVKEGETIVLLSDIALDAPIAIAKDAVVAIDLAGFVLSYESTIMGEAMITNRGQLSIYDSGETGEIFYNYVGANDASYGKGNYTISNSGTLVIWGGKIHIANLRAHAKYPVDNNSTTGDATLIVYGGHLYNYNTSAIRMFCNSTTYTNRVVIDGGLIEGYCAIWMQNPGKNTVNGQLAVYSGEIRTTAAAYVNGTAELAEVTSKIYCTIDGAGGAWSDDSYVDLSGGLFNENVYLAENAPLAFAFGPIFNGRVELPHVHDFVGLSCTTDGLCSCGATESATGHNFFGFSCTSDGVCDCGEIKPAAPGQHNLIYVPEVVATTCLDRGNPEYWYCDVCNLHFGDAEASSQINPDWLFYTGDCQRPEDAIDCATVSCVLCGEDVLPVADHYTGVEICQDGTCQNCGAFVEGWGCENYDTPACEDGFCSHCGDPVEGLGHENGAWAPCEDGECTHGCGLQYPATEEHVDEDGNDYCEACYSHINHAYGSCGGYCTICWGGYVETTHEYMYECDAHCKKCGEYTNADAAHNTTFVPGKPATCTENGVADYYECSLCGYCWFDEGLTLVANRMSVVIPAPGHNYIPDVVEPTCTLEGYTDYACECGDSYTDNTVPALGHKDENSDYKCDKCSTKMLPADGEALTIPQALAIGKLFTKDTYTTQKYYITGIVTNVYNTTYGNLYLKDANGNQICIYGLYTWDGAVRYDAMSYKPVEGDELTVYTVLGFYTEAQGKSAWLDEVVAHEHNYTSQVTDPTCLYDGYTTHTCSICSGSYTDSEVEALGHTTDNGTCERCGMTIGSEAPAEPVTVSKTIKELITQYGWTNTTTKQSFNLDDVVSVKINGGSNTGKAYNGDHIRIYATDTPAGTMTITVPEGYELVSVKISTQTGSTYAYFNIDGVTGDVCNKTVDVSGNSVVLNSVKNGTNGKQVRVTAIEVVYKIAE